MQISAAQFSICQQDCQKHYFLDAMAALSLTIVEADDNKKPTEFSCFSTLFIKN